MTARRKYSTTLTPHGLAGSLVRGWPRPLAIRQSRRSSSACSRASRSGAESRSYGCIRSSNSPGVSMRRGLDRTTRLIPRTHLHDPFVGVCGGSAHRIPAGADAPVRWRVPRPRRPYRQGSSEASRRRAAACRDQPRQPRKHPAVRITTTGVDLARPLETRTVGNDPVMSELGRMLLTEAEPRYRVKPAGVHDILRIPGRPARVRHRCFLFLRSEL
jgi:hypothetical protein